MSIQKETGYFKAFRDEQAHAFSFLNQGRPLYLSGSFISVNQKINVGGEVRTVMKPTEGTYYMIHALYGQANQFIRNEDTEQLFNDLYGVPQEIYTALPSSAIRSVKMQVGSEENFAIQSIGAEFLDAKGIYEPLHTLFMYRIVDGNYNVYYALSTSMAMLEYKSNELHNAPEIEYRNVTFAYDKKDILKDVSFKADKGTMTALVGPSGGGKSTIASLLTRFWDVKNGEILLKGTDIRKIPLAALMDNISMVFQRVYLFQDTVYNNIALGRPDASREEVIEAAKKARCYDFIMELPDGFDTLIGEGGASLSGGQAQRLSIARCILKDSPIVILDEATASVDADNESYIQQAISELCKGKTLLVIAHRLNTIAHADHIMVIKDGEIAESGDHKSLMDMGGIYHNMVTKRAVSTGWKN